MDNPDPDPDPDPDRRYDVMHTYAVVNAARQVGARDGAGGHIADKIWQFWLKEAEDEFYAGLDERHTPWEWCNWSVDEGKPEGCDGTARDFKLLEPST